MPGQVGGSEEYLVRQLLGLVDCGVDRADRPVVYCLPSFAAAHPELARDFDLVTAPVGGRRRPVRVAAEHSWLAMATRGAALVHHGGGTVPAVGVSPQVLTVHDLQYRKYPEYFTAVKRRYLGWTMPRSVRRADVVTVPTEFVAGTVVEAFGVDRESIVVVPHGVETGLGADAPDPGELRERYGLGAGPVVVYPAITHPHKNHRFLIELLATAWTDPDLRLVLLGGPGLAADAVSQAIAGAGVGDRVVRPGRVPAADRDGLVALADALVFPSEYEGFGAPVIEAMALGTPIVASDRAALPEVVGDAGLVRPLNVDAWAGALDEIAGRRNNFADAGRQRAAQFTAKRSGEALWAAYQQARENGGAAPNRRVDATRRARAASEAPAPAPAPAPGPARGTRPSNVIVLCPHFDPDTAPTGRVMTRIVTELADRGYGIHVVTALPWYRSHSIEPGWEGRWVRTEHVPWGTITRVHPFPGADKTNLLRRGLGFLGFSALVGVAGLRAGGWLRRADAVIAMSPPLTMGLTGRIVAWAHRGPEIFNVQDVFPDAAVETGAITNQTLIAAARWLERASYRSADAVTILSDDLHRNVAAKVPPRARSRFHTIPNFVDTDEIQPCDRMTAYRRELGIGDEPVVLYAGNVGFSQSLDLLLRAAPEFPHVTFLINGEGSQRAALEASAAGIPNVRFGGYVPSARLGELLATGDIHVVPLKRGLATVSVPSKTYSILAAGRPVLASIDAGTEIPRILEAAGAGVAVAPDDQDAFNTGLRRLLEFPQSAREMGESGRRWVEQHASPRAIGEAYDELIASLSRNDRAGEMG